MTNEVPDAVERFKKRFSPPDIVMSRVPKPTLDFFKQLAQEEFAGDYGMCLKYLCDVYKGLLPVESDLVQRIEYLEQEMQKLQVDEKTSSIKTCSGKTIGR